MLDAATGIDDLRVPPGNRLERLRGDRAGQYSIRINRQRRICFRWDTGDAHDVEIVDYHQETVMPTDPLPPVHPGAVLMEEFLGPMELSQYRLAKDIGVPPRRINEIVHGNRVVTADTALRLARYFGSRRPQVRFLPAGAPEDDTSIDGDHTRDGGEPEDGGMRVPERDAPRNRKRATSTRAWRRSVNAALVALTGYELRRADRADQPPRQTAHERRKASRRAKYALHRDFDDASKDIIKAVRRRTMTSSDKLFGLITAVRYVVEHDIPGDIVECGVWRGGSMQAAAMALLQAGSTSRNLYLFDTFEGMPPPSEVDRRRDGRSAAELLASADKDAPVWAIADLDDVRQGMEAVGYPTDNVHYVEGMVEDTIPDQAPDVISILRLDTDWYASTRHELTHLYPRLSSGGVLIIDDYGYWQGSRKAVEEFLAETGARLLLTRISGGRLAVKP